MTMTLLRQEQVASGKAIVKGFFNHSSLLPRPLPLNLVKAAMIMLLIFFSCLPSSKADDVSALIQKLKEKDQNVQWEAVEALGKIGTPAVEPLIVALKDKNKYVRSGAVWALGNIKDVRAVEPLIASLKDEDRDVRWGAAGALGNIKDVRSVEPLTATLKDADPEVRWRAAWVLGDIKDTRAVEPLIAALKDNNWHVRLGAAAALGKIKDARAVEPLIAALKDKDLDVQRTVAEALEKIGITPVDLLIAALKDQDPNVRKRAAKALESTEDARAVEPLTSALKQEDLEIVAGAYRFFIRRAEPGTETVLIKALNKYGTKEMAQDFVNCGNNQLAEAGHTWAKSGGYEILPFSGDGPRWRSSK